MNIFKTFGYMLMAGVAVATAASCSDPDGELTSVEYARYFTPTDVTMRIVDETSIEVEFVSISKAESYEIEFHEGETVSGPLAKTVTLEGKGSKKNTVLVPGFLGKTTYIAQVRATGAKTSNWAVSDKFVTTKEEQILVDVQMGDITETSIKVRWKAGEEASTIHVAEAKEEPEFVMDYTLTEYDQDNAYFIINGLTAGTDYNVTILLGERVRGKKTYSTAGSAPKPVVIEGVFIDYQAAAAVPAGITLSGTTAMANAKIHENTDAVDAIQLKNGYTSENVPNDNYIKLSVEGGFKAGDKVTIAGFFNNADDTKKSAADLYVLDAAAENGYKVLFTTQPFINGRTMAGDPVAESYVLTEDAENLYIGRNGNTGTNICLLQVERGEGGSTPDEPGNPDEPVGPTGPAYGSGITMSFAEFAAGANPLSWSKEGLVLKAVDEDGKMSCDGNSQYFGEPGNYINFTTRLKSSGKSSAKLGFTITVPAAGKLFLFMRTGSNSATRTVTVSGVATASLSVGEANVTTGTVTAPDGTVTSDKNIYTPYELDATAAGDVVLEFDGSINIYGLEFRAN